MGRGTRRAYSYEGTADVGIHSDQGSFAEVDEGLAVHAVVVVEGVHVGRSVFFEERAIPEH